MMFITGIGAMATMEQTADMSDDVPSGTVKDGYQTAANFDLTFGVTEMLSAIYEVTAFIYWYQKVSIRDHYALAATILNVGGWSVVYGLGVLALLADFSYDTGLLQRCFHYSQLVVLVLLLAMEQELVDLREKEALIAVGEMTTIDSDGNTVKGSE